MKLKHYGAITYFIDNFYSEIIYRYFGLITPETMAAMEKLYSTKYDHLLETYVDDNKYLTQIVHGRLKRAWCFWPKYNKWQEVDFVNNKILANEVKDLISYKELV